MSKVWKIKNSLNWLAICLTAFVVACSSDNSLDISDKGKNRGGSGPLPSKPVQSAQLSLSQVSVAFGDFVEFEKSLEALFNAVDTSEFQTFSCPRVTKDRSLSTESLHYYHLDWRYCRGGDYQRQGHDCAKVALKNRSIEALELTTLLPNSDPRSKKGFCAAASQYEGLSLPVSKNTTVFLHNDSQSNGSNQYSYSRATQFLANQKDHTFELTVSHSGKILRGSAPVQFRYVFDKIKIEWFDTHNRETTIDEVELSPVLASPLSTTNCHILIGEFTGVTRSTRLDAPLKDQDFTSTESEVSLAGLNQKRLWPSCKSEGELFFLGFLNQYFRTYKIP